MKNQFFKIQTERWLGLCFSLMAALTLLTTPHAGQPLALPFASAVAAPLLNSVALPARPSVATARYRDGELLIKFKSAAESGAADPVLDHLLGQVRNMKLGRHGRMAHIQLAAGQDVAGMQRWYEKQVEVEYAEPNYLVHKSAIANDLRFNLQWGLRNTGQKVNQIAGIVGADINIGPAWDRHTGDGSVVVAVIDTGVDYRHPDLAANIWSNSGEIAANGRDDDGNGKIDDIRGWNFAHNNAYPMDDDPDGHGSHVAGIIGAVGNNALGGSGVNWNVKLMPLKALSRDGSGNIANIIAAIDYAIEQRVSIINASYAFECGAAMVQSERDALIRARDAGILVVLPAGNEACNNDIEPTYPASHALNNIVSVAASDAFDQRATYGDSTSNYGAQSVHLFAPGKNIYSTIRVALGNYGYLSGTSMAAPFVSGAAALLKSYRPELSALQVREILLKTASSKAALAGQAVTQGRLDVAAAMDFDLNANPPMHPSHLVAQKHSDNRIELRWLDDSPRATGWQLEYRDDPAATFNTRMTLAATNLTYQDTSMQAGEGTYHGYRIRAFNNVGASAATAEVKIITPPLAPDNLRASSQNGNISLSWSDRSNRESGYRLERANTGDLFNEIAQLPANSVQYEDRNFSGGVQYHYRVRSVRASEGGVAGEVGFANYSAYSTSVTISPASASEGGGGGGCFIATAAYGSSMHPKVVALRYFRDEYLMPHPLGRALVKVYYRISPPLANFIAQHEALRAGVRILLWPWVWLIFPPPTPPPL